MKHGRRTHLDLARLHFGTSVEEILCFGTLFLMLVFLVYLLLTSLP
jgi:hypothetical protein